MSKRRILVICISVAAVMLAAIIAISVLVGVNFDKIYVLGEKIGIVCRPIAINESTVNGFVEESLSVLLDDPRVSFDQSLILVNTEYMLKDDFVPQIKEYKQTGVYMSECMIESYAAMSAHISDRFGKKLYVSSDLRTKEEQEELYAADPNTATLPGASEHQTGLALDVYVAYYAGDGFVKSDVGRYVNSNSWKYGFIIRYPSYAEDVTGIRYEPWHIRYVGHPHADVIYNNHTTLEEYILSLEIGQWYEIDGYLVCRQEMGENGNLEIPESFDEMVISPDNTGCYIITVRK